MLQHLQHQMSDLPGLSSMNICEELIVLALTLCTNCITYCNIFNVSKQYLIKTISDCTSAQPPQKVSLFIKVSGRTSEIQAKIIDVNYHQL